MDEDCGKMVTLTQLIPHLENEHPWTARERATSGGLMSATWQYSAATDPLDPDVTWSLTMHDFSGHIFFPRILKREGIHHVYVRILANEEVAKKFRVRFVRDFWFNLSKSH